MGCVGSTASDTENGAPELSIYTARGREYIEAAVIDGNYTIESGIEAGARELSICAARKKQDIESAVIDGNDTIASGTEVSVRELSVCTARVMQDIELAVIDVNETIASGTEAGVRELSISIARGMQDIESAVIESNETIASGTEAGVRELSISIAKVKHDIESAVIDGNETIASGTEAGLRELSIYTARWRQDIESAVIDAKDTIASGTEASVRELSICTASGRQNIESAVIEGDDKIASAIAEGARELSICTAKGRLDIESAVIDANDTIASGTEAGVRELSIYTARGRQDIESAVIDINDNIASGTEASVRELSICTARGKQAIESAVIDANDTIASGTEAGVRELSICTASWRQDIESAVIDGNDNIASAIAAGGRELSAHTTRGRQVIKSDIEAGREELLTQVDVAKREFENFKSKKDDEDYHTQCKGMLQALMNHYNSRLSQVTISPLNDWVHEMLDNIYMPPNLQVMAKDKGSFQKTGRQITDYKQVFFNYNKRNKHMFIQGEAGSGKSTFLAKLVMDWCSINTTKSFRPSQKDGAHNADSDSRMRRTKFFEDLTVLKAYKFVFHIILRDSVEQIDILEMIKQQIIDSLYGKEGREDAYKLLNVIMERERCLVLLDGVDEWKGHGGHYLPTLAASYRQCDVLITTRPWKLTKLKIPDSTIDILLQLEGVDEPFHVSKRLLACVSESKENTNVDKLQSEFESYIHKNGLYEQLVSPLLLLLIVQLWTENIEIKGSKCAIYSLLLECLLKTANSETSEFQQPPFRCFTLTQYIGPNIEHVDRLAEAAFYLLFSDIRENSLVFSTSELKKYNLDNKERLDFLLKSGILSATRNVSTLRSSSSFSFIHKSMQEFLAAYHIARNSHLIDDVISGYLIHHKDAYLDISHVFIFLCGLDISAANTLSSMMNDCAVASGLRPKYETAFQKAILSGYREAVANEQTDSCLKLSHFYINESNAADCHSIWIHNKSTAISLDIDKEEFIGEQLGMPASRYEFDLSSSHKLQSLELRGEWIGFKDSASVVSSDLPVWIVLHCADPQHCRKHPSVLSSIKKIVLRSLKWSSTWLRSLFCTLLNLRHKVECVLERCKIMSCVDGEVGGLYTYTYATIITGLNHTFELVDFRISGPGLWKALYGLNIKYMSLKIRAEDLKHDSPLLQSLLSIKQLEQLSIDVENESHEPLEILFSLNIKCVTLSVYGNRSGLLLGHGSVRLKDLLVSKQIKHIYINLNDHPKLFKRWYGLKIKSLTLVGNGERLEANNVPLLLKALSSLKQLEELSLVAQNDSRWVWQALIGLKIKLLNIGTEQNGLEVKHISFFLLRYHLLNNLTLL